MGADVIVAFVFWCRMTPGNRSEEKPLDNFLQLCVMLGDGLQSCCFAFMCHLILWSYDIIIVELYFVSDMHARRTPIEAILNPFCETITCSHNC